jgi:MIP family channel proteins
MAYKKGFPNRSLGLFLSWRSIPSPQSLWSRQMSRSLLREMAAEFLGTFILIMFGVGVVAQVVLSGGAKGDFFTINCGWGVAVTMGVYVAGGISGAHLNPAVTVAMATLRGFPWRHVLPYSLAQLAGALVASVVVFATYHEALDHFDGGERQIVGAQATAGIWATYPQPYLSNVPGGLVDQVVGTALLVLCVFALTDNKNMAPSSNLAPVLIGAVVFAIGMTFGYNSGYAINPARDLGPRLFTAFAGWGSGVFRTPEGWWWVPIVGPLIGGVLGGLTYDWLIYRMHPQTEAGD